MVKVYEKASLELAQRSAERLIWFDFLTRSSIL